MTNLDNFNIENATQFLKNLGIDPKTFTPETINKLMQFTDKIKDPTKIDPQTIQQIKKLLNLKLPNNKPNNQTTKIGRNDICPCNSGKKWKKCCLLSIHHGS